jgi:phage shock protein E
MAPSRFSLSIPAVGPTCHPRMLQQYESNIRRRPVVHDSAPCAPAMDILTSNAESGTLHHMTWQLPACSGTRPACAGLWRPKETCLSISLLLAFGLAAAVRGETNVVAKGAVMETNRMYVIDVRTDAEWKAGHIKDAILIPYDEIKARIAHVTTDKSAHIAVYCRSGRRSGIALKSLQELGYRNVENLGSLNDARKKLGVTPDGG